MTQLIAVCVNKNYADWKAAENDSGQKKVPLLLAYCRSKDTKNTKNTTSV